jgi:flagellar basal-body rod protein FlgB
MFENIFGIHEQALMVQGQRMGVLAANLANADTPGYKARDIDFAAVLSGAQGDSSMPLAVTDGAHITLGGSAIPIKHPSTATRSRCRWSRRPFPRPTSVIKPVSLSSTPA